jgi:hypothetical protein
MAVATPEDEHVAGGDGEGRERVALARFAVDEPPACQGLGDHRAVLDDDVLEQAGLFGVVRLHRCQGKPGGAFWR